MTQNSNKPDPCDKCGNNSTVSGIWSPTTTVEAVEVNHDRERRRNGHMSEITVTQLRKTNSFPQEWEGMTSEGHFVAIRQRSGQISFGVGVTKEDAMRQDGISYTANVGTMNTIPTDKMKGILGPLIEFET